MGDFIENFGLRDQGFTDDEIAQIDGAKDDLSHVIATIQEIWPRLTRLVPVATMVIERIAQHQKESK